VKKDKIKGSPLGLADRYKLPRELSAVIKRTFDKKAPSLPSGKLIRQYVNDDYIFSKPDKEKDKLKFDFDKFMVPMVIRDNYLQHAFVAYNDELLTAMTMFCAANRIKSVSEVLCGTGWFSHWMKRYGIPVKHSVDNKSWIKYKRDNRFLPIVKEMDAAQHVRRCRTVQLFVMSWPYMDPVAANVWKAMKPGNLLLYIGEGHGGCTANDEFFELAGPHEVSDEVEGFSAIQDSFVRFWGLHDRPILYRKK